MLIERISIPNKPASIAMSASLAVVAAVAMYGWIVSPHVGYLQAVQAYEPVVARATRETNALSRTIALKRRRLQDMQSELHTLRGRLFTEGQARSFFSDIETLCGSHGCDVASIRFDFDAVRPRSPGASQWPAMLVHCVTLRVLGEYGRVGALLSAVQDRPQQVRIDSCRMERLGDHEDHFACDIVMTVWVTCDEGGRPTNRPGSGALTISSAPAAAPGKLALP